MEGNVIVEEFVVDIIVEEFVVDNIFVVFDVVE